MRGYTFADVGRRNPRMPLVSPQQGGRIGVAEGPFCMVGIRKQEEEKCLVIFEEAAEDVALDMGPGRLPVGLSPYRTPAISRRDLVGIILDTDTGIPGNSPSDPIPGQPAAGAPRPPLQKYFAPSGNLCGSRQGSWNRCRQTCRVIAPKAIGRVGGIMDVQSVRPARSLAGSRPRMAPPRS